MVDEHKSNGWNEWAKKVLGDIERLEKRQLENISAIENAKLEFTIAMNKLLVEIAILKTQAAFIGGVWGAVVAIVVSVISALIIHLIGVK